MLDWLVGVGIEYSDGGAAEKLRKLSTTARSTATSFDVLKASAAAAAAGISDFSERATAAAAAATDLNSQMRASASAGNAAAGGANRAAAGFNRVADAASAAAAATARYNIAFASGAVTRAGSLAFPSVAAGYAFRTPGTGGVFASAALRGGSPLALAGGSAALATAAGAGGAGGGGGIGFRGTGGMGAPGGIFGRAYRMVGGGGSIPPGGGPPGSGGGGGGFNFGNGGSGFNAGMLPGPGWLARKAFGIGKDIAIAGTGVATDALYEAGKLQQQLTLIQVATGATQTQMARISQSAYDLSNATAQSVAQSASIIGVMASSGINDPKLLTPSFINTVGKFADVQYLKSGGRVSFEEGARQAIQLAHQNQAYTPDAISKVLETVSKLSFMMPDSLQHYLTQSNQYVPLFRRMGVPQEEQLVLGTFMDRMGSGRGRGGTSLQNFLLKLNSPLAITGHAQAGQRQALVDLGVINANGVENPAVFKTDAKGNSVISIFAAMESINRKIADDIAGLHGIERARKEREDIGLFQKAFGIQGGRFGYMATPEGIEQLLGLVDQLHKASGIDKTQNAYMRNFNSQVPRAWGNFQSLLTEVGGQAIPGATKGVKDLGDALHFAQGWLHQHADLEMKVQRDIIAGVIGTERYLVAHHKDWEDFGHDILYVAREAKDAGPTVLQIASAFGELYKSGRSLGDALNGVNGAFSTVGKWIHDHTPHTDKPGDLQGDGKIDPAWLRSNYAARLGSAAIGLQPPLPPVPLPSFLRQPAHAVHHTVTIDVRGGDDHTKDHLRRMLREVVNEGSRDPRHQIARSGTIHTSAQSPNVFGMPPR